MIRRFRYRNNAMNRRYRRSTPNWNYDVRPGAEHRDSISRGMSSRCGRWRGGGCSGPSDSWVASPRCVGQTKFQRVVSGGWSAGALNPHNAWRSNEDSKDPRQVSPPPVAQETPPLPHSSLRYTMISCAPRLCALAAIMRCGRPLARHPKGQRRCRSAEQTRCTGCTALRMVPMRTATLVL